MSSVNSAIISTRHHYFTGKKSNDTLSVCIEIQVVKNQIGGTKQHIA